MKKNKNKKQTISTPEILFLLVLIANIIISIIYIKSTTIAFYAYINWLASLLYWVTR